ncbi:helicase associated domain-containing protein [Kitasatospora sp. NPDC101155]|uniref:helicase associated domain-containing protein n=1 Tax=Kitasatospora sp. NPDC101155 TaxID=3364097 RepID=UPI00380495AE
MDENVLALFIASRVLTDENQFWREGVNHARRWHKETGRLDVPYSAMVGEEGNFPLGKWLSDRRRFGSHNAVLTFRRTAWPAARRRHLNRLDVVECRP